MMALYQKVSKLTSFAIKSANVGKLFNLVSNDLNTLEMKSFLFISTIISPMTLFFTCVILYYRFGGWIGLVGPGVMMVAIPI